jgi:hypothetical protein
MLFFLKPDVNIFLFAKGNKETDKNLLQMIQHSSRIKQAKAISKNSFLEKFSILKSFYSKRKKII